MTRWDKNWHNDKNVGFHCRGFHSYFFLDDTFPRHLLWPRKTRSGPRKTPRGASLAACGWQMFHSDTTVQPVLPLFVVVCSI